MLKDSYGEKTYAQITRSAVSKYHHLEILNVGIDHFKKYDYPRILLRLSRIRS